MNTRKRLYGQLYHMHMLAITPASRPTTLLSPEETWSIREVQHVSQTAFARYRNVSRNLVSDWKRGEKKPSGPVLRLLSIVRREGLERVVQHLRPFQALLYRVEVPRKISKGEYATMHLLSYEAS